MPPTEGFTVLVTTFNAVEDLAPLIRGLSAQEHPPDEVLIIDAGSTDGTREAIEAWSQTASYPVHLHVAEGANISQGRNLGVQLSSHRWVAVTDAGCEPQPQWLEALARAREGHEFVSGIYRVVGETPFEQALAVSLYPDPDEIGDQDPLGRLSHRLYGRRFRAREATGRSMAFTTRAWRTAGGFPESVRAGEDIAFSASIVDARLPHLLEQGAVVHWRPRRTWQGNARMYFGYARGDVRFGGRTRHLLRMAAWSATLLAWTTGGRASRIGTSTWLLSYVALPVRRAARRGLSPAGWWRIPLVMAMKDGSMLAGAVVGTLDALRGGRRGRPPAAPAHQRGAEPPEGVARPARPS